ncbi:MAG: aminofutalosine synthase MqnE [Bacteroidales bacterium]|nr:aminofutalosine synthase MqnE [Bacteroidales bacterium]MDD4672894.1 aminofutalosine synthase MqnE [Bacteroidales bacterium]
MVENNSIASQVLNSKPVVVRKIAEKVLALQRISFDEAAVLYKEADLGLLGMLADRVNAVKNSGKVYFNQNFHIEPTNICVHNCTFCSYRRALGEEGSWEMSIDDIRQKVGEYKDTRVTEVHITGGVHPNWDINYFGRIIRAIKEILPSIHVKAFSAIEIDYVIEKAGVTLSDGIRQLKLFGLDSIPGGGAEIADPAIRKQICGTKTSWKRWLEIHEAAHNEGLQSNATMLYGHIESYEHRVKHMLDIRELQDRTHGFNSFIPLKFKATNNELGSIGEVASTEDLRNFAVSRVFLDNFDHIKAYWPMLGKEQARLALEFGADDFDGTVDDSTKIYSMAGSEEQRPSMTVSEVEAMIRAVGRQPVERDSLYNSIRVF